MSIEQAKAALFSTAMYAVPGDVKNLDDKLRWAEANYRRMCDIVGFDTPEETVLRRLSSEIEQRLRREQPSVTEPVAIEDS